MENAVTTGIIDEIESQLADVQNSKTECIEKRNAFDALVRVYDATEQALAVQLRAAVDMAGAKSVAVGEKAAALHIAHEAAANKKNLLVGPASQEVVAQTSETPATTAPIPGAPQVQPQATPPQVQQPIPAAEEMIGGAGSVRSYYSPLPDELIGAPQQAQPQVQPEQAPEPQPEPEPAPEPEPEPEPEPKDEPEVIEMAPAVRAVLDADSDAPVALTAPEDTKVSLQNGPAPYWEVVVPSGKRKVQLFVRVLEGEVMSAAKLHSDDVTVVDNDCEVCGCAGVRLTEGPRPYYLLDVPGTGKHVEISTTPRISPAFDDAVATIRIEAADTE